MLPKYHIKMLKIRAIFYSASSAIKSKLRTLSNAQKIILTFISGGVLVLLFTGIFFWVKTDIKIKNLNTIHVFYVARYTQLKDSSHSSDQFKYARFHEIALLSYLKNLESKYAVDFKLDTFDNRSDSALSVKIYEKIGAASKIEKVLVIDNSWGHELKNCSELIKKDSIPVISLNADHNSLDYGGHALFIGHSDNSPGVLAKFIHVALNDNSILFITEKKYWLTSVYKKEFKLNGNIKIVDSIELENSKPANKDDSTAFETQFQNMIKKNPKKLIVFNCHHEWGEVLIDIIKRNNSNINNLKLLLPVYSTSNLSSELTDIQNNEFIVVAASQDAISKKTLDDVDKFKHSKDSVSFNRLNLHEFIYRCIVATDIVDNFFKVDKKYTNRSFNKYLHSLANKSFHTNTDEYYFGQAGKNNGAITFKQETIFSTFKKGKLSSYDKQLDNLDKPISNLFFGMEIENINNIDVVAGKYGISFYYWFKADSTKKIDIDFPQLAGEKPLLLLKRPDTGKTVYQLYKVSGVCNQDFDLKRFPFDEQTLCLTAEVIDPTTNVSVSFDEEMLLKGNDLLKGVHLENWALKDNKVTVDNKVTEYSRGIVTSGIGKHKSLSFWVKIKRDPTVTIINVIIPLFIIGLTSIIMLFLRERAFKHIGEASAGLLITAVLYSISLTELTPSTGILKKTDWIFWITLIVVVLNFLFAVLYSSTFFKENREPVITRKLARIFIIAYPVIISYIIFS